MPNSELGAYSDAHYVRRGGRSKHDELTERITAGQRIQAALLRKDPGSAVSAADRGILADAIDARRELDDLTSKSADTDRILAALNGWGDDRPAGAPQFLSFDPPGRRAMATAIAETYAGGHRGYGSKGLIAPDGSTGVQVPLLPAAPVAIGRVVGSVPAVVPVIKIPAGSQAQWLQQTSRVNAADSVLPGELKPQSTYGLTKVTSDLVVVAHITEPIDRFILEDSPSLTQFLADELTYGVQLALENQILNGDPATDPSDMRGWLHTSGVQTCPAGADVITTIRQAITKLESSGYATNIVVVVNPVDWERAELERTPGSGELQLTASPVNRAAFTIWGCPVSLSNSLPAGTAVLFSQPSVGLYVDTLGMRIDWAAPGDAFQRNQIVGRGEMRAVTAAFQPAGIVKVTLPAVTP